MREIALFVEDSGHQAVIGALLRRLGRDCALELKLDWRNTRRGHGRVVLEYERFLQDLKRQGAPFPDLIVVATDANCKGLNERTKELDLASPAPVVLAIPDPHIERWLLIDGAAFREVFGRGCGAPDQKCSRDRYKQRLINEIRNAGVIPSLGGIEFAQDIVDAMDIERAARSDASFKRFIEDIIRTFQSWKS